MKKNSEQIEISLLLEALYQKHGYDFRQYSESHVIRRIKNRMLISGLKSISQVQEKILHSESFAAQCIADLSITVTEMFRDPSFYLALRELVVPLLRTYPFIKIWNAGCATGEEAYSMAILLYEEGLYDRATIYASDFNQNALNRAKEGIFSNGLIKEYTQNYQKAGGTQSLSNYYTAAYDTVIINRFIKKNIVWANHNLVTDNVFAEVNLILCRNVMIYFEKELQDKVHELFYNSLANGGILCLGLKESLRFSELNGKYSDLDKDLRIFKKKY